MYAKRVCAIFRALIYLIIDCSDSMDEMIEGGQDSRATYIERYLILLVQDLLKRSSTLDGKNLKVKDLYYIRLLKYGSNLEPWQDELLPIGEFAERYVQAGSTFGIEANLGGTDPEAAFAFAEQELQQLIHLENHRHSYPPLLMHLTDALAHTDSEHLAERIKQLTTTDGNTLVSNVWIGAGSAMSYQGPEDFPGYLTEDEVGPDEDLRRLFRMSSVIPDTMYENLRSDGIFPHLRQGCRLFFDVRSKSTLRHIIQSVSSIGSRSDRTKY